MNKTKLMCLISGCVAAAGLAAILLQIIIFAAGRIFNNSAASQIGIIGGADTDMFLMYISNNIPFLVVSLIFIVSLIIFIVNLIKMLSSKKAN